MKIEAATMNRNRKWVPIVAVIMLVLAPAIAVAQDESGGQSGADFLLSSAAARADAMGGVVDGQGDPLEGMFYNPSILMLDPNIRLNVAITPFPNGVTDAALAFGAPIGPGMLGVAGELVSLGEFTFINSVGQPQGSVTVFDAAGAAGYSMEVLENLAVGASAKFVYRTLGEATAIGVGMDAGATWWFETPHIGQRPKPPTMEQLENQRDRQLAAVESEKGKRTQEAAGDVADLREDVEKLQADLEGFEADFLAAEEDADTTNLETRIEETRAALASTQDQLSSAENAAADDLAAIEVWYNEAVASAQAAHAARVADLREIEVERARLFEVVDDPDAMLTADAIISNIEDAIARTREFARNRTASLREAERAFLTSRQNRISEIADQIAGYESQIADIAGADAERLRREIRELNDTIEALEAQEEVDNSDAIRAARGELSTKQDELEDLENDPWIRRLQRRIEDKEEDVTAIQAAIDQFAADTAAAIERLSQDSDADVADFEALSQTLQTDLRRAQLRLELDRIDSRSERAALRSEIRYETEEQRIYSVLLSAMYENEERIFVSRRELANQDSLDRQFEFGNRLATEREAQEDEFAFQERFLSQQINQLNREEPVNATELESTQTQLDELQASNDEKLAEFSDRESAFANEESDRLAGELQAIRDERQKVRLIYLQTDDPYQNTAITFAVRNLGTNLNFDTDGYPMPRTVALGASYAVVNTDLHSVRLSTEAEMPLYGAPTFADLQVGIGLEYGFAGFLDVRAGYAFGSPDRTFSLGVGADFALGFTNYALDYSFRPIPDYGLLNTIGISIGF